VKGERKGTITYGLQFSTRRYQCFNELYNLFYINKIKIIPDNIYDILTPIALAYWIMGDGARKNKGLILCTDSYSLSDVIKLSNVLRIKYNLNTTISGYTNNRPRIYIVPESMPNLIKLVKPYILESFWYKLQLNIYINN
jgi:LAGLIDADG DNA endonuclease family